MLSHVGYSTSPISRNRRGARRHHRRHQRRQGAARRGRAARGAHGAQRGRGFGHRCQARRTSLPTSKSTSRARPSQSPCCALRASRTAAPSSTSARPARPERRPPGRYTRGPCGGPGGGCAAATAREGRGRRAAADRRRAARRQARLPGAAWRGPGQECAALLSAARPPARASTRGTSGLPSVPSVH